MLKKPGLNALVGSFQLPNNKRAAPPPHPPAQQVVVALNSEIVITCCSRTSFYSVSKCILFLGHSGGEKERKKGKVETVVNNGANQEAVEHKWNGD